MLTHQQRVAYLPIADRALDTVGAYAAYQLDEREYVGEIAALPLGAHDAGDFLEVNGYEPHGLAALKYHPETEQADDGSYRKVDPDSPRWQWHVHLFENDGVVEVYSHYEYRPDLRPVAAESIAECLERLREHYRPTWDVHADDGEEATYFLGETCDDVRDLTGGDR